MDSLQYETGPRTDLQGRAFAFKNHIQCAIMHLNVYIFYKCLIHNFRLLDCKKEINIYIEYLQKMKLVFLIHLKFLVL